MLLRKLQMRRTILVLLFSIGIQLSSFADNTRYVNMFLGTSGDHGQMAPGAACPFGMISVCPDSKTPQHAGYDYSVPEISGISINRVSGIGCRGCGGNLSVLPDLRDATLSIVDQSAHPGYYSATLSNGVRAELTATVNMAVERYVFNACDNRCISIDFASAIDKRNVSCFFDVPSCNSISGWVESPTACARGQYKWYFSISSDNKFSVVHRDDETATFRFPDEAKSVELRIAVSPVSQSCADDILQSNVGLSFDRIHKNALSLWRDKLDRIQVKGSTEEQRTIFYTLLYRLYLSPMMATSNDGKYKGTDGRIYECKDFTYYSSWSIWDSFRSKFPLLCLIDPSAMRDISRSLADIFRTGKRDWATPHESVPTVRTEHSVIMLLDAYVRGAADKVSLEVAYPGMKEEAGRLPMRTPDQKMESSYDLWALGKIAEILGQNEDARKYSSQSDSIFANIWPSEFMEINDDFAKMKGNGLYQGSRWQYRWAAPHCIDKMIALEGKERLCAELSEFFDRHYFNQGNEPDIHTPFLFNMFGAPEMTQKIVRDLLTDENMVHIYGGNAEYPEPFIGRAFRNAPDGLAPEMDEDDGTMSAWYIFSSIGLYPAVPGDEKYEVFAPLYDKVRIKNGESVISIRVKGRKHPEDVVKKITVNGKPVSGYEIPHSALSGRSRIVMR